jgi:hypothetical protein
MQGVVVFQFDDGEFIGASISACKRNAKLEAMLMSGMKESATQLIKVEKTSKFALGFLLNYLLLDRPSDIPLPYPGTYFIELARLCDEYLEEKLGSLLARALEKSASEEVLSWESWPAVMICAVALDHKQAQESCARFWSKSSRLAAYALPSPPPPAPCGFGGGFGGEGFGMARPVGFGSATDSSVAFKFNMDGFGPKESGSESSVNGGFTFKSSGSSEPKKVSFPILQQEVQRIHQELQKLSSQGGASQAACQRIVQQVQQVQSFLQQAQQQLQQIQPVAKQLESAQDLQSFPLLLEMRKEALQLIQSNLQAPVSAVSAADLSKQALKKVRESTDDHLFARVACLLLEL